MNDFEYFELSHSIRTAALKVIINGLENSTENMRRKDIVDVAFQHLYQSTKAAREAGNFQVGLVSYYSDKKDIDLNGLGIVQLKDQMAQ